MSERPGVVQVVVYPQRQRENLRRSKVNVRTGFFFFFFLQVQYRPTYQRVCAVIGSGEEFLNYGMITSNDTWAPSSGTPILKKVL